MAVVGLIKEIPIFLPNSDDARQVEAWEHAVAIRLQNVLTGRGHTSGATTADIITYRTRIDTHVSFKGWVLGRRVSGSGSHNDGYALNIQASFKNKGGTITTHSSIAEGRFLEVEDVGAFDASFVISAPNIILRVTGATGYEMAWFAHMRYVAVGV